MKPGALAFEGAACEKRLKEWIFYLADYTEEMFNNCKATPWHFTNMNLSPPNALIECFISKNWPIIALGNNASKALIKSKVLHFKLPHPSGRNRQINDKAFIEQKLKECKEWLKSR